MSDIKTKKQKNHSEDVHGTEGKTSHQFEYVRQRGQPKDRPDGPIKWGYEPDPCRAFMETGVCPHGEKCELSHPATRYHVRDDEPHSSPFSITGGQVVSSLKSHQQNIGNIPGTSFDTSTFEIDTDEYPTTEFQSIKTTSDIASHEKMVKKHQVLAPSEMSCKHDLLSDGGDADANDETEKSLLMTASERGCMKCVVEIASKVSNIDAEDVQGKTALLYAYEGGSIDCITLLLKKGAAKDHTDAKMSTPLMHASKSGNVDCLQWLYEQGYDNVNDMDCLSETALMNACQCRNVKAAQWLLNQRARVNDKDDEGTSALMYSVERGSLECFEILLNSGADIRGVDNKCKSVLMYAARGGNAECVKLLLKMDPASVDLPDKYGNTALLHASIKGNVECMEVLIQEGDANVNMCNHDRKTALMCAVEAVKKWKESVALLRHHNAKEDSKDIDGFSAVDLIKQWHGRDML